MLLKKDAKFNWTDEFQNAFEELKESLITKPILHLYDPDLSCHVFLYASQKSVGAVLKQPDASNVLHPIAYHSRTLRDYEKNYAVTELECLAIIDALDKFYYYLHGQNVIMHSDHAAVVWLKTLRGRLFRCH
ncbi:transposon Ty3-G Gag-Pol polyprotein [Trichonephila clavipes]|nr:transposon Ty3-G Gag-Pol polyprotein [Trichonephila clavipes]